MPRFLLILLLLASIASLLLLSGQTPRRPIVPARDNATLLPAAAAPPLAPVLPLPAVRMASQCLRSSVNSSCRRALEFPNRWGIRLLVRDLDEAFLAGPARCVQEACAPQDGIVVVTVRVESDCREQVQTRVHRAERSDLAGHLLHWDCVLRLWTSDGPRR